ncbi:PEP-CTERM sorting domain-containing protein [Nitrosospira sp. Is2]|uniref:PEP-CTERM sorting domain-containing protein n=1 Tax=Nitrosospira sp. Is2 TaxID=3080532 RepID=UPI0029538F8D|nr:PEP-CTERM sorting domain-containing protein [Nitrosospira sp. Is2]WON74168.1 PEP-CTERM sorting domain-containing protein [Nitrosospira sp. Is2]
MRTTNTLVATLAITLSLGGGAANANFSGPYDVSNWKADGVITDEAPASITLYHQAVPMGESGSSSFVTKALDESNVSFNWNTNVGPEYAGGLTFEFLLNGVYTLLADSDDGSRSGSFSQRLHAGDEFGFNLCCSEHFALGYSAKISEFSVTTVPEPETYALLVAGLGLVGVMAGRRSALPNL